MANLETKSKLRTKELLAAAVAAAEEKKGENLRILELDPAESGLTDFFLVASGTNPRQVQAIADEVEFRLKQEFGEYANSREGYKQAEWILLDYVDFVVHVFSEEKRAFYDIERLRKSAHTMTPEDLRRALVEKTASVREAAVEVPAAGKKLAGKKRAGAGSKKSGGKKSAAGVGALVKTHGTKKGAARKGVSKSTRAKQAAGRAKRTAGSAGTGSARPSWAPKAATQKSPKSKAKSAAKTKKRS
jgi:ribosome-associated protein